MSSTVEVDTDVVFLSGFSQIWTFITVWTCTVVGLVYFTVSLKVWYVNVCDCKGLWIPFLFVIVGVCAGFVHGAPMSAVIAGLYTSIPYDIGSDIATGLGIAQGILIVYFHFGRGDFVHRFYFSGFHVPTMAKWRRTRDTRLEKKFDKENKRLARNPRLTLSGAKAFESSLLNIHDIHSTRHHLHRHRQHPKVHQNVKTPRRNQRGVSITVASKGSKSAQTISATGNKSFFEHKSNYSATVDIEMTPLRKTSEEKDKN
mmetsp:Transcript_12699/g.19019  ORF Transcript_12699/g.19019 Transcript_12699/m.19019 type:complete len:258 (-) Transcript_12699:209-982(-)